VPVIFSAAHSYGTGAQNIWEMRQYQGVTVFNVAAVGAISVLRKIVRRNFVGDVGASE
jgi:hypothetical protein